MSTHPHRHTIPPEILALSHERDLLRRRGHYDRADAIKQQIEEAGYGVKDNPHGAHLIILPGIDVDGMYYRMVRHMPSLLDEADQTTFSVNVLGQNSFEQTRRCIESVFRHASSTDIEVMLVDNASQDGLDLWAEAYKSQEPRLHILRSDRLMGAAEARNVGMKQSRGHYILLLDSSIEIVGDVFTALERTLAHITIGITGYHGLCTEDLRHFVEKDAREVEAVDGLCMAFRRVLLKKAGLFDERYRFAPYMDIDFNFAVRDAGGQVLTTPDLPIVCHPPLVHTSISDAERQRLTKRNFYRFLEKWGGREDLLPEV